MCNICLYLISQQCAASYVIPFDVLRKPPGRLGIFHGWIGVFHCASYRTENNNPVLKKWFQSQKRQNKKKNNNCQLPQDRGFMHNGPQRGKVDN